MPTETVDKKPITFNPVVSIICWVLSTVYTNQSNDSLASHASQEAVSKVEPKVKRDHHTISWKDERMGGNVREYVTSVQNDSYSPPNSPTISRKIDDENIGMQLARKNISSDSNDADHTTPSPNWGFYVPITPPQQDSFRNDKNGHNIVSDYRLKPASST